MALFRARVLVAMTVLFSCMLSPASDKPAGKLFLLEDAGHHLWCAYADETTWKVAVEKSSSDVVATIEYISGRASKISFTQQDETGDWIAYDRYSLGDTGALEALNRTVNVLPGNRSVEQTFTIKDGKFQKKSTASRNLDTHELIPPTNDWLPDLPVMTNLRAFPFFPLLGA